MSVFRTILLLLTLIDIVKYIGRYQKSITIALALALLVSMEEEAAENVHDRFITKNCEILIIEIFVIPFCLKGRYQEKDINKHWEEKDCH